MSKDGGYDDGYGACHCFWGTNPGSLVVRLREIRPELMPKRVLDVGCGEGKNAIHFARQGVYVDAIDISRVAIKNAKRAWRDHDLVNWQVGDIQAMQLPPTAYDLVIAYGVLHCLPTRAMVLETIRRLKNTTRGGGLNLVCAFNDRFQDLAAHPNLSPVLLGHTDYLAAYDDWTILMAGDEDLHESHPHNMIAHTHAMTRLIAEKGRD